MKTEEKRDGSDSLDELVGFLSTNTRRKKMFGNVDTGRLCPRCGAAVVSCDAEVAEGEDLFCESCDFACSAVVTSGGMILLSDN